VPTPPPPAGRAADGADGEQRRIAALLDGVPAAVAEVRGWVRVAAMPYRDLWRGDLEDLEQEALVAVLAGLRSGFRGEAPLRAYVRSIVHHHCIDRLRATRRRTIECLEGLDIPADEEPAPARLLREEEVRLALRVQAAMPRGCQELWQLVRTGWSYGAMAERLGVAEGALRVRVLRCRRRALQLRDEMIAGRNTGAATTTKGEE
jgi:RNA polymerase sigma factor (sigma-70 family)